MTRAARSLVISVGARPASVNTASVCSPSAGAGVRIVPGVRHVEVDAEHHLDLVRRLGVLRTPTTLVLDPHGREVSRASGAPSKQAVIASLEPLA